MSSKILAALRFSFAGKCGSKAEYIEGSGSFSFKPLQKAESIIMGYLRNPGPARAGSECIRDRCKRTGIGTVLWIVKQT